MPIRLRCSCGKDYKVPDELAGKKIRCKACGATFSVRRPQRSIAGATKKRPRPQTQARTKAASGEEDFDDAEFGNLPPMTSTASPGLPPRRLPGKKTQAAPRKAAKRPAADGGDSLEERLTARTSEGVDANMRRAPWKQLLTAVVFFGMGIAAFYCEVKNHVLWTWSENNGFASFKDRSAGNS